MPSFTHEAPLALIRERPSLVVHLLREVLNIPVPPGAEPVIDTADHVDLGPIDRRASISSSRSARRPSRGAPRGAS